MAPDSVQPLRIQKSSERMSRPLADISPMGIRRNSPSLSQVSKNVPYNGDSSPFDASPASNSPRLFWKGRESESPTRFGGSENAPPRNAATSARRNSLEKLQKASRVKNSNMFALENSQVYDPDSSSIVERPIPNIRQLNKHSLSAATPPTSPSKGHKRSESNANVPLQQSPRMTEQSPLRNSPLKRSSSPYKSSLSANSRYIVPGSFDPDESIWTDDGDEGSGTPRALRQAKTVSFDAAPPQINEYEMITPDPSSVASGSRESSYDSESFDMDGAVNRGSSVECEDSFDESLEDAGKMAVVLPEDWRFMSPEIANTHLTEPLEDPFEGDGKTAVVNENPDLLHPSQTDLSRSDSINSDGERRPLPPLPPSRLASDASKGPSADAQEAAASPQATPRAADISRSQVTQMITSSIPLEERVRHLTLQEQSKEMIDEDHLGQAPDEDEELTRKPTQEVLTAGVEESDVNIEGAPRISRESILRSIQDEDLDEDEDENDELAFSPEQAFNTRTAARLHGEDVEHEHSGDLPETAQTFTALDYANLDPDVPIPSREASSNYEETAQTTFLPTNEKHISPADENASPEYDLFNFGSMPALQYIAEDSPAASIDFAKDSSVVRHDIVRASSDDLSQSDTSAPGISESDRLQIQDAFRSTSETGEQPPSTDISSHAISAGTSAFDSTQDQVNLPDFTSFNSGDDYGLSFQSYRGIEPPETFDAHLNEQETSTTMPIERPHTPAEQLDPPTTLLLDDEIGTPESVIHHEVETESGPESELSVEESVIFIPEPVATVKASGGKLKTRPSASAADLEALRAEAFHTSDEQPPAIPAECVRPSSSQSSTSAPEQHGVDATSDPVRNDSTSSRRKSAKMSLDVPLSSLHEEPGLGLDHEFDRLLEAQKVELFPLPLCAIFHPEDSANTGAEFVPGQGFTQHRNDTDLYKPKQKGYLMRQNTKVVVASNRNFSSEHKTTSSTSATKESQQPESSIQKPSGTQSRKPSGPTFTTEPWNGKMRRHSTRKSIIAPDRRMSQGPAPPLPGHDSNATSALEALPEDHMSMLDPSDCETERGRLFVKVVGVKSLDLPLPKKERSWFQLTLDNGLHCVTTAWLELGRSAPIGQEFELTVFDELDFSLTLQTRLDRPQSQSSQVSQGSSLNSPTKKAKASALSRLLTSPKKRREAERRQQEEEAQAAKRKQEELEAQRAGLEPTAWDLLHNLVGSDGSFARAIVDLAEHEKSAFGRPHRVDVPCFNEWATEDSMTGNSTRSKHGGVQRKPPYKIGDLELQLLYISKPRGVKDEEMPQSMSACIRQLDEARTCATRQWEGHLSQQGGDCPYWRRRFFKLNGSNLSSYHETTRQRRANINLSKATRLIDDKSSLTQSNTSPTKSGKGRRKSAFAEDEEGYMFVEEGFRIRFANGEIIDFYADNRKDKEEWMRVLADLVGKDVSAEKLSWTTAILAKERADAATAQASVSLHPSAPAQRKAAPSRLSQSVPTSPIKNVKSPALPPKDARPTASPTKSDKSGRIPGNAATSLEKPSRASEMSSPTKPSPTKRHSGLPTPRSSNVAATPRARQQAGSGRRQAVRSMIF
ncbi:MAG: Bud site selection protein bud4 [Chrysothrix sp. TS-e1954]|nr:MAG: Bud site selection protein bud4 [Chrysothrix sp. TS-e1954]